MAVRFSLPHLIYYSSTYLRALTSSPLSENRATAPPSHLACFPYTPFTHLFLGLPFLPRRLARFILFPARAIKQSIDIILYLVNVYILLS